ncbi:MAG: DUF6916 family protein [Acidimicrobiales bacterium]
MSRRDVLKLGAASIGVAATTVFVGEGVSGASLRRPRARAAAGKELRYTTFEPLVGETFTLHVPGRTQHVKLVAVKSHPTARPGRGECFSLLFTAPRPVAASGNHVLANPVLGSFSMFLSPVGLQSKGQRYEAVVNRF